jgi:hypothetical protein
MDVINVMMELLVIAIDAGFKPTGRIFPRNEQSTLTFNEWEIDFSWRWGTIWFKNNDTTFIKCFEAPFDFECLAHTICAITDTYLPEDFYRDDILSPYYSKTSFMDDDGDDDGDGDDGGGGDGGGGGDTNSDNVTCESN